MIKKKYCLIASIGIWVFLGGWAIFDTIKGNDRAYRDQPVASLIGCTLPAIFAAFLAYLILRMWSETPPPSPPPTLEAAVIRTETSIYSDMISAALKPSLASQAALSKSDGLESKSRPLYELSGYRRLALAMSGTVAASACAILLFWERDSNLGWIDILIAIPLYGLISGLASFVLIRAGYWVADGFRSHNGGH